MQIQLKPIVPEQIPAVTALIQLSVRTLQAPHYTEAQREAAIATVFTVDTQLVADGTYFGAFTEHGTLVGCGGWSYRKTLYGGDHQLEQIAADCIDPATDAAKIRAIFVHPDWAHHGIGSRLLEAAEHAARTAGFRRFEMGSTLTGFALYLRRGYREAARMQVPVGDGQTIEVVRMLKNASGTHLL